MREHATTDAHFDRPAAIPPHTHAPTSPINARLGKISSLDKTIVSALVAVAGIVDTGGEGNLVSDPG
jgi:hypothetical protein